MRAEMYLVMKEQPRDSTPLFGGALHYSVYKDHSVFGRPVALPFGQSLLVDRQSNRSPIMQVCLERDRARRDEKDEYFRCGVSCA